MSEKVTSEGKYRAKVTEYQDLILTKGMNDDLIIHIPFVIIEPGTQEGRFGFWERPLKTAKGQDFVTRTLRQCFGFDGDYQALCDKSINLEGKEIFVEYKVNSFDNKEGKHIEFLKCEFINPVPKPASSTIISKLTAQAKSLIAAGDDEPPPFGDDDVPPEDDLNDGKGLPW